MALKGQGDTRWIVETRDDGTNVNHWHWTETDFTNWTKDKLKEILEGLKFENDKSVVKTTTVSSVTGEVSVNTRKGKTFIFYELDVTVKWEGTLLQGEHSGEGTIRLPYISEELEDDEFEIQVTIDKEDSRAASELKSEVRGAISPVLKEKIPLLLSQLREMGKSKTNLQLKQKPVVSVDKFEEQVISKSTPTQSTPTSSTPSTQSTPTPSTPSIQSTPTPSTQSTQSTPTKQVITTFSLKESFLCRPVDLFECLMDGNRVKAYAGGDARMSKEKGFKFSMFSGSVTGENIEVIPPSKIVQKWRFSSWPANMYSTVTMELTEKSGKTQLNLTHSGVPESDRARTEHGWSNNFFNPIKGVFGFGKFF